MGMIIFKKNQILIFNNFFQNGINKDKVKRRDFTMNDLLNYEQIKSTPLFSDTGSDVFLPRSLKEYSLVDLIKLN